MGDVDEARPNLFSAASPESPAVLAGDIAGPATTGHFDELRGRAAGGDGALRPEWARFFDLLGEDGLGGLDRRMANLRRQIRDNGVTYNVYAEEPGGAQRPWSVDLFPLILSPETWRRVETGVLQRVRVMDHVMADVYGPQRLLASGLLPAALVHGHPGYLREMQGVQPAGGNFLHIAAFDLARGPDGNWWVVSQRTQAPSGLGYLLENRLAISRQFPEAFESMQVQRLAATYSALVESLKRSSPAGSDALIVLLTPGPYNETYFEHAYLARYLGLTLVEGSDLTVRGERLYLKTLEGLKPVHGLLKRLDDEFLDPLELRSDSTLGVPGLLQAVRAGNVLVANAPGSAFLESPALLGFLPALARHLLGEELTLPALPTWWCGEQAVQAEVLTQLGECVVKPTYPASPCHESFEAVLGGSLSQRQRDEWTGRILRRADEHTLQAHLPLSQMPTWQQHPLAGSGRIAQRSVLLRVFAVSDGPGSWRVLPGGMARVAGEGAGSGIASMQRGGSSADVWVLAPGEVDPTTLLQPHPTAAALAQRKRLVTSRAAENLFWLGRYTERAENTVRLARLVLRSLNGDDQFSQPLIGWLSAMAADHGLVLPSVPAATQARRVFERSLIAGLAGDNSFSVGYNLRSLRLAAAGVRERLAEEHWSTIVQAEEDFFRRAAAQVEEGVYSSVDALRLLESASGHLAAITGGQTDRMTRDDGWRLLSIGRHIERLGFLASALQLAVESGAAHDEAGFEGILAIFDSTITFHAQYQQTRDIATLVDIVVMDRDNPRSLGWVAQTLRGRLAKLAGSRPGELSSLSRTVPDPDLWDLAALCVEEDPAEVGSPDEPGEPRTLDAGAAPAAGTEAGAGSMAMHMAPGTMAMSMDSGMPEPADPAQALNLAELLKLCTDAAYALSDAVAAVYFTHSGEKSTTIGG